MSEETLQHHLLLYAYVEDVLARRGPYRAAHLDRITAAQAAGTVVMAGAIGDPPTGAAIVFAARTPEQIAAWIAEDPYVTAGLVTEHRLEPWTLV